MRLKARYGARTDGAARGGAERDGADWRKLPARQAGAVLVLTMWIIVLLSMLVLTLASEARLTAEVSRAHVDRTSYWADTMTALNAAEMELVLERMPEPAEDMDPEDDDELKNPDFRFSGQPLELVYAAPESMEVRIYDHAGKINLANLTEDRLGLLIEKMMLDRTEEIDDALLEELLAAWGDWLDEDDGIRVQGAEIEYYQALATPYLPRQGPFETVEEILLVRGFADFFAAINLSAAFTLYSESDLVNLNTATREALALLPGLDEAAIDAILAYRAEQDFTDFIELEEILDADQLTELQPWVDFTGVSEVYTIVVVPRRELQIAAERAGRGTQPAYGGFAKTIRVVDYSQRPAVLRVDPMPRLPAPILPPAAE